MLILINIDTLNMVLDLMHVGNDRCLGNVMADVKVNGRCLGNVMVNVMINDPLADGSGFGKNV